MSLSLLELHWLYECSVLPAMNSALQQVFRAADSAITQLAKSADTNADQNRYFEAVQALRIVKPELIAHFGERLLLPVNPEAVVELPVDVEHVNSLHKLLSINLASWRADTPLAAAILDLQQRLAVIDKNLPNPLSPEHVVDSFLQSLGETRVDINTKMLMLRMFEVQLYSKLERYVRLANDALSAQGILPELDTEPSEAMASMNALVEEALGQEADAGEIQQEVQLFGNALADLQANDFENIDSMLGSAAILACKNKPDIRNLAKELQKHKLLPAKLSPKMQMQMDKIELVGKLFQFIMDDNNLPLEARALLVCLQLPYARIAVADARLLQSDKHPAKALLNELVHVCASWQPDRKKLNDDGLFKKISNTVKLFIEAERIETIPHQELLFEYLAFGERQRQKNAKATQRLLDSQIGAEVADTVRDAVNTILEKKIGGTKIPGAVRRIFDEGWNNVLYMTALQKGLAAPEWQQGVKVVDDLLRSVQPASAFQSRYDFIIQLPPLLASLRKGLVSIDLSSTLINQLFSDLEDEHKKIAKAIKGDFADLERLALYKPEPEVIPVAEQEQPLPEQNKYIVRTSIAFTPEKMQELANEAIEVVKAGAKDIFSAKTQEVMSKLGQGASLLWNQPKGQIRCRIAAHIKHTRKFILTDRSGAKLAEISEFDIAQKIDSGEIESMASEQVFDRALESVIGNIRDRR
jgi:hypothetical protein